MQCPACNHIPLAGNQPDPLICPKCGVAYADSIRKGIAAKQQGQSVSPGTTVTLAPHVRKAAYENKGAQPVVIVDLNMSFGSMIVFMIKWAIASIPALIILCLILVAVVFGLGIFTGLLGLLGRT